MQTHTRLYYIHDPMCSWCWAFRPVWQQIQAGLPDRIEVQYLLGGLAPDTDQPMPPAMQRKLKGIWQTITDTVPGTEFNFDFWDRCQPRRSTYPACRAVVAAAEQDASAGEAMILAIQQAYYLRARNPSDTDVLVQLAMELGLDAERFRAQLAAPGTQTALLRQITRARTLGINGFPSLLVQQGEQTRLLELDYKNPAQVLSHALLL